MKNRWARFLSLGATVLVGLQASAVVSYSLTTPRYFKDDSVQMSSPAFVDGVRGVFPEGSYSSYGCNAQMPEGYYASGWQLDKAWGTSMSATTILSWGAQDSIGFTFDPKWAEKYKTTALELSVWIDQKTYSVSYDANGGTWSDDEPSGPQDVKYWAAGLTAADDSVATRSGYTLVGWNTTKTGRGVAVALGGSINGSVLKVKNDGDTVTLYAQWTPNRYPLTLKKGKGIETVYYKVNGTSDWAMTQAAQTEVAVDCDSTWYAYATPATGYSYDESSVSNPKSGKMGTSGAAFECAGVPHTITVSYGGNGSTSGSTGATTFKYDEAKTLTRNGFVRKYRVTYNANGGSVNPSSADAAYAFVAWNDRKDGGGAHSYEDEQLVTNPCDATGGTVVLYAQWGAKSVALPQPKNGDLRFSGWYTQQTGGERVGGAGDSYTPTEDSTLFARWVVPCVITVSVDPAEAGTATGGGAYEPGEVVALDVIPAEGYSFSQWSDGDLSRPRQVTATADATYVAQMRAGRYVLNFDAQGGVLSEAQRTKDITYGAPYGELPEPTAAKASEAFLGWYTERSGGAKVTASDIVRNTAAEQWLYAQWGEKVYAISYETNGGMIAGAFPTSYKPGETVTLPTDVTKTDALFDGWYDNVRFYDARVVQIGPSETGDKTFYAKWRTPAATCALVYAPGVRCEGSVCSNDCARGTKVVLEGALYHREGYAQWAWSRDREGTSKAMALGAALTLEKDETFYPCWSNNTYTIAFDGNGGTGDMPSLAARYDEPAMLSSNRYVRANHAFCGWTTRPDAPAVFGEGETVSNLTATARATVTLYAVWRESGVTPGGYYTIRFSPNADVINPGAMTNWTVRSGDAVTLPDCAYTNLSSGGWAGWVWDGQTNKYNVVVEHIAARDGEIVVIPAVWEPLSEYAGWVGLGNANLCETRTTEGSWQLAQSGGHTGSCVKFKTTSGTPAKGELAGRVATLKTTVQGPGIMSYWVKGADAQNSRMTVACGNETNEIEFTGSDYVEKSLSVSTGLQTISWNVEILKQSTTAVTYYLDDVTWTPSHTNRFAITTAASPSAGGTTTGDGTYDVGTKVTLTASPNADYVFVQWNDGSTNLVNEVTVWGDITDYKAAFEADVKCYAVVFDGNGADNPEAMPVQTCVCGEETALAANVFTRPGYLFRHWLDPRTGQTYANGASVADLAAADGAILLRAVWTSATYVIAFEANGGTGAMTALACRYDSPTQLTPNAFVRAGHAFTGWATQGVDTVAFADRAIVRNLAKSGEVTLSAVWEAGEPPTPITVTVAGRVATKRYSGVEQFVSGYELTIPAGYDYLPCDVVLVGSDEAHGTVPGHYPMGLSDGSFSNRNERFAVTFDVTDGGLDITLGGISGEPGAGTVPSGGCSKFDASYAYDGTAQAYDVASLSNAFVAAGYAVTNVAYAATAAGPWSDRPPWLVHVGVTSFWYRVSAEHYAPFIHEVRLVIVPRDMSLVSVGDIPSQVTTGLPIEPSVTVTDGEPSVIAPDDYDVAYENNVDPGEATVTLTGKRNYAGTKVTHFTILPKPPEHVLVTVTGRVATNRYDRTEHAAVGYAWTTTNAAYRASDFVCTGVTNVSRTVVGTSYAGLAPSAFQNLNAGFVVEFVVARDISVTVLPGTVVREPGTGKVPPGGASKFDGTCVYDGTAQAYDAGVLTNAFAEAGYVVTNVAYAATLDGPWREEPPSLVDAGATSFWYRVSAENYQPFVHAVVWSVLPRDGVTVTVTGHAATNVYDGAVHVAEGYDVSVDSPLYAETDFVFDGTARAERRDAGVTPFGMTPSDFCNTNGNFGTVTFVVRDGEAVVLKAELSEEPGAGTVPPGGLSKFDVAVSYDRLTHTVDETAIRSAAVEACGADAVVTFASVETGPWTALPPSFREVGSHVLWYRIESGNYETYEQAVRVTIAASEPVGEVGRYFGRTLSELGLDASGATSVKVTGLPSGLSLKKLGLEYYVEGVPTAPASTNDGQCAFVRIVRKVGKTSVETMVAMPIEIAAASVRTITPSAVLGVPYAPTPVGELWPEVAEAVEQPKSWSFVGWPTGLKYTTRDIARQADAYDVYGTPTKAGVFTVTATRTVSSTFTKATLKEKYGATFMTEPEAGAGIAYRHQAYVAVSVDLAAAYPGLKSVTGLPTGLKYAKTAVVTKTVTAAAGEVYGTPTKAGVYVVTLTLSDRGKRQILWQIDPGANAGSTIDVGGSKTVGGIVQVEVGLPVAWALSSETGAKLTVTGLPTGLSYKGGRIAGVPTKAGNWVATVKTIANGVTVTQTFAVTVTALPTYLVGTYYGASANAAGTTEQMTLTVTATGKVSGGFYVEGKKVTFSAASLDRRTSDGRYVAAVAYKYDRLPYEDEIVLATTNAVDGVDLWFASLGEESVLLESVDVRRDVIKDVYGKIESGTYEIEDPVLSEDEYLRAKVAATGVVTVSGKLADATERLVSVSCSTRLAVLDEERLGCWITVYKTVSRQEPITYVRYWELPKQP